MFFWYIWQTYSTGITNVELEQPASLKTPWEKFEFMQLFLKGFLAIHNLENLRVQSLQVTRMNDNY